MQGIEHKYLLEEIVSPEDFILDIGANIGYYALIENQLLSRDGKLLLVEPSPSNAKLLRRNLELNNVTDISVLEGAVSSDEVARDFYLSKESNLNTFHNYGSVEKTFSGDVIRVDMFTIPSLVSKFGDGRNLNLIRMDVWKGTKLMYCKVC